MADALILIFGNLFLGVLVGPAILMRLSKQRKILEINTTEKFIGRVPSFFNDVLTNFGVLALTISPCLILFFYRACRYDFHFAGKLSTLLFIAVCLSGVTIVLVVIPVSLFYYLSFRRLAGKRLKQYKTLDSQNFLENCSRVKVEDPTLYLKWLNSSYPDGFKSAFVTDLTTGKRLKVKNSYQSFIDANLHGYIVDLGREYLFIPHFLSTSSSKKHLPIYG